MGKPMPPDPVSPAEAWNALVDFADGAEMDRIDALSPEEVAAELVAAGLGAEDRKIREYPEPVAPPSAPLSGPDVVQGGQVVDVPPARPAPPARSGDVVTPLARGTGLRASSGRFPFVFAAAAAVLAIVASYYLHLFDKPHDANPDRLDPTHPAPTVPHVTPAPERPAPVPSGQTSPAPTPEKAPPDKGVASGGRN